MKLSEFDYELAPERIAQAPARQRDASRLLVLERESGGIEHRRFRDLPEFLKPGDLLVLNDTRVVPARLVGTKPTGGRVELLLIERVEGEAGVWICLLRAARAPGEGGRIDFGHGIRAEVLSRHDDTWRVRLAAEDGALEALLGRHGRLPLPPYIRREDDRPTVEDRARYQTVYARHPGAVAAPTAGLHFTSELLDDLSDRGVEVACLTLHVGPGTFQPVRTEDVEDHRMAAERYDLPPFLAESIDDARRRGGRVVAVGTSVVRTLESCALEGRRVTPGRGNSTLFIYPGYRFRVVDALITNFHLPRSTLLMLVCAFAGRERILAAYREAVREGYRFYSYGDAMLAV